MPHIFRLQPSLLLGALLVLATATPAAAMGLREAAAVLERQLQLGVATSATQSFQLPLVGSAVVLSGEARLELVDSQLCRRTLELVHNRPFEHRGLRITSINRRSVQDGPCRSFADAMAAQADISARSIAVQIGVETAGSDPIPGERMLVAQPSAALPAVTLPQPAGEPVTLIVREKAIIRDAPHRDGEKLSRADVGTRLQGWRIAGNADWFALDGGLRFISASVVDTSRLRLTVIKPAVLRNAPSSKAGRMASLSVGAERFGRKVPGRTDWFELLDSGSLYPLYIHASVVAEMRP